MTPRPGPLYRVLCADQLDHTWAGRTVIIGRTTQATILTVQQWPTAHRTILTTIDGAGVTRHDVRDDTVIQWADPAYTSGDLFGGAR